MTNSIKKVLISVLCFVFTLCLAVGVYSVMPTNATSEVISLETTAQANLLSKEKSGLRFKANLTAEYKTLIETYGEENVKAGMMILPSDLVEDATTSQSKDFTVSGIGSYVYGDKTLAEQFNYYGYASSYVKDGDGYYFYMTMPNIAETNYNRNFTAKAFIEITASEVSDADFISENGKWYSYTNTVTANVYEVAYNSYVKTEQEGGIADDDDIGRGIAKEFMDKVAVLSYDETNGVVISNNVEDRYTSPYSIEKDGLGNYIVNGNGVNPASIRYNGARKTELTFKDTDNKVAVNTMLSQEAKFGENNFVSLQSAQVNGASSKGNLQALSGIIGYVAFNGEYGVGTYVTTTFKGNNMPQVMFFSNVIDGDLTGVAYNDETRQGVIAMNGVVGYGNARHATNLYKVIGPNRMSVSNYTSEFYINLNILNYENYPLLTQDGLNEDNSDITYRYTVGTYLNSSNAIIWEVFLYNNDTDALIYHEELKLGNTAAGYNPLTSDDITASNIVIYSCLKGSKNLYDTDFTYSMPFSREEVLKGIVTKGAVEFNDRCDSVTLSGVKPTHSGNGSGVGNTGTEDSYIAFEGDYGVGNYVEFIFSGNNMPYLNLFANTVDGFIGQGGSSGSGRGIVIINGIVDQGNQTADKTLEREVRCDEYTVWGPKRYTGQGNGSGTPLISLSYNDYPLLTQKGLKEDTSGRTYRYRVGTYYNTSEKLTLEILLCDAKNNDLIYHIEKVINVDLSETGTNIIALATMKGRGVNTTFSFSRPYVKA